MQHVSLGYCYYLLHLPHGRNIAMQILYYETRSYLQQLNVRFSQFYHISQHLILCERKYQLTLTPLTGFYYVIKQGLFYRNNIIFIHKPWTCYWYKFRNRNSHHLLRNNKIKHPMHFLGVFYFPNYPGYSFYCFIYTSKGFCKNKNLNNPKQITPQ